MSEYRPRFVVYLRTLALGLAVAGAAGPLHAEAPPQKTGVPPTKIGVPAAKISVPTAPVVAVAPLTADTAASAKRQGMMSAGGLNWRCQGLRCTTSGAPTLLGIGSCQALAREVGQIRRFASAKHALSAAELSQCNLGISAGAVASIGTHTTPIAGLPSVSNPSPSKGGATARTLSPARTQAPKGSMLPPPVRTGGGFAPATPINKAPTLKNGSADVAPRPGIPAPPAPGKPSRVGGPVVINAETLRYTGRGPVVINAETLRYVGRGAVVINADTLRYASHALADTKTNTKTKTNNNPILIQADTLRFAGRGAVVINAEPLRYAGRGPVVINADTLRYAGRGPVVINANTLRYSGTTR